MPIIAENKKAYYDYFVDQELEAGIVLLGFEVKAVKTLGASLNGSHVVISNNEAFVLGMKIPYYVKSGVNTSYKVDRTRKILLRKSEINAIIGALSRKGFAVIPLKLYTDNDLVKVKIGIGRGKKQYDKREVLKKREIEREIARAKREKP